MQGLLKRARKSDQNQAEGSKQAGLGDEQGRPNASQSAMQGQANPQGGMQQPGGAQPGGMQPGQQQGPQSPQEGDRGNDEDNPVFRAALGQVRKALYVKGADEDINKVMANSDDPVQYMSDLAYEMTAIADEKTEGEMPRDLLPLLAGRTLEEIVNIAENSGVEVEPADIAMSFKDMLLRYLGENGYDTSELEQAMDQVDPQQVNQFVAEIGNGGNTRAS